MSAPPDVQLEYAFTITLEFGDIETLPDLTRGFARGALYLKGGEVSGPRLNGRVLGGSGGDWAEFRPDGTVATDARYMIEADDGTHILMRNRGFLWGRSPTSCRGCASGCSATAPRSTTPSSTSAPRRASRSGPGRTTG